MLGILIFLVPLVFAATVTAGDTSFAYNDYVTGVVVFVLAAISIWAAKNDLRALAWLEGINTVLGLWTIVAPFVLATNANATYANVALGVILVIVAAWDSYVGMMGVRGAPMTRRGRTV